MKGTTSKMKGAVLIIGSLYWEEGPVRVNWRNNFLKMDESKIVSLPIRYGRKSITWKNTYTMVFSSDLIKTGELGKGYLVPLKMESITAETHCRELIKAEKNDLSEPSRYNWDFFSVGLLTNPKSKSTELKNLENLVESNIGDGFKPDEYKIGDEEPIITKQGKLKIDWSEEFGDNEFLICTAIKSGLKKYPEPIEIAKRMIEENHYEYFCKNRNRGITTFCDDEIESYLP